MLGAGHWSSSLQCAIERHAIGHHHRHSCALSSSSLSHRALSLLHHARCHHCAVPSRCASCRRCMPSSSSPCIIIIAPSCTFAIIVVAVPSCCCCCCAVVLLHHCHVLLGIVVPRTHRCAPLPPHCTLSSSSLHPLPLSHHCALCPSMSLCHPTVACLHHPTTPLGIACHCSLFAMVGGSRPSWSCRSY